MKIVIEIPQEEYQKLLDGRIAVTTMRKAIRNGTVLSEAQADGEYIPRDAVIDQLHQSINLLEAEDRIRELPTDKDTITMTREEFSEKLMEHYRQGRADEKVYQNGEIMQSFNPD